MTNSIAKFAVLPLICLCLLTSQSQAGEQVRVTMKNGRVFSGQVHSQSDNVTLRLHVRGAAVKMVRPVRWERIRSIAIGDQNAVAPQQAVAKLSQLKSVQRPARPLAPASTDQGSYAQQALELLGF